MEYDPITTPQKYPKFVVERVLQRGNIQDFLKLISYYKKEKIIQIIKTSKRIPVRTAFFLANYYSLKNLEICSITQSKNLLWKF